MLELSEDEPGISLIISNDSFTLVLTINVSEADSGKLASEEGIPYYCQAQNSLGTARSQAVTLRYPSKQKEKEEKEEKGRERKTGKGESKRCCEKESERGTDEEGGREYAREEGMERDERKREKERKGKEEKKEEKTDR